MTPDLSQNDDATISAAELSRRLDDPDLTTVDVRPLPGYTGWPEWAADATLAVDGLPNYDKLVYTDWLRQLLDGGRPEAAPAGPFLLFHVNFGVPEEYEEGHIPGALYLDTNLLESREDWNRRSPEELEQALCSLGITRDTTTMRNRDEAGKGG